VVAGSRDHPAGTLFADRIKASFAAQLRAIRDAQSVDDLFRRFEDAGALLRIDPAIRPTMYRCATVTRAELEQLRRITDAVRLGHLLRVDADGMVLDGGAVPRTTRRSTSTAPPTVPKSSPPQPFSIQAGSRYKACADANKYSAPCWSPTSAAYPDDSVKNRLCVPLPHPDTDLDWLRIALADYGNQLRWLDDPDVTAWLAAARLDLFGHLMGHLLAPVSAKPRVRDRILSITKSALSATAKKLDQLMLACNPR
jgi:hypothetical protein